MPRRFFISLFILIVGILSYPTFRTVQAQAGTPAPDRRFDLTGNLVVDVGDALAVADVWHRTQYEPTAGRRA